MRTAFRRLAAAALPLLCLTAAPRAGAVEVEVGGKPMLIDVTNTSIVNYHFDNRDSDILNDNYGEWLDRLNVQANWWRLRLGARIDTALFFLTPDAKKLATDLTPSGDKVAIQNGTSAIHSALHSRYLRAIYPSKLFIGYQQPSIDVTAGDFYVQLGRGLVFSVRKIDEVAVDTTVRGGKIIADRQVGPVRLATTLFAGQMNPLRVDEVSGRRLNGLGSPLFFGFPRPGTLETYQIDSPGTGRVFTRTELARPNYLEDTAYGGRFEVGTKWVQVAGNAALLLRRSFAAEQIRCVEQNGGTDVVQEGDHETSGKCASQFPDFSATDQSKLHNRILNFSGSINVPSLWKHGDVYVEVAGQQMRDGQKVRGDTPDLSGYAVYGSASANAGPVSMSVEFKHYRSFYPLAANIDTTPSPFSAPEYSLVTYSQPPTAEPTYTEIVAGAPGVCVTGGRARVDYRFNRHASAYAWLGRYASWSENPAEPNETCKIEDKLKTNTWDSAVGAELSFENGKSHAKAWIGVRTTDRVEAELTAGGLTSSFYHEGYIRYDLVKHIKGPFSLQFQGFHRRRSEPIAYEKPWMEGENYTALQWSPHLSAVFGYEYMTRTECQPKREATATQPERPAKDVCHFVNGGITWRSSGAGKTPATRALAQLFDTVGVFVGQRRQAVRCVNGTCRQFPPFEGAKLEITSRF